MKSTRFDALLPESFGNPLVGLCVRETNKCGETARDLSRSVCMTQCVCVLSNPKSGVLASSSGVQKWKGCVFVSWSVYLVEWMCVCKKVELMCVCILVCLFTFYVHVCLKVYVYYSIRVDAIFFVC